MILVGGYNPTKVRYESKHYSKIARKTLRSFIRIEWSSLTYQVDLRRLEAAKDDSALVGQYIVGSIKAQPIGVLQE
jgi:hypothetical protein